MEAGKYIEAISAFEAIEDHKDSKTKIDECHIGILDSKYYDAVTLMEAGKYIEAISAFEAIDDHKDSKTKIDECHIGILDDKYNDAIELTETEKYEQAISAFKALDGYKDSAEKANSTYRKYMAEKMKNAKMGDYVFFGAYEQDNKISNGKEYIEWLVLEVKDGRALLISTYALDCKPYDTTFSSVTWETCYMRNWLNRDFLNAAFTEEEEGMISTVTVSADENPLYSTLSGNATQDRVFLLSIPEANRYFKSDSARQCKPTAYAEADGAYVNENVNCRWWLRSAGCNQTDASFVSLGGSVNESGSSVDDIYIAVRPALWVTLDA